MNASSLRVRMLVAATACVLITLAVAGSSLVMLFERQVLRMVGEDLDVRWADLSSALTIGANGRAEFSPPPADARYEEPRGGAYWQISENGVVVARSGSLIDSVIETTGHEEDRRSGHWFEVITQQFGELYVIEREVTVSADHTPRRLRLTVATDHDGVANARNAFMWDVVWVLGLLALLLIAAAALQLWLTLNPLKRLGLELAAIHSGGQARFQSAFPSEVAPLAEDLNLLLDRQEGLVAKARERAGSLAHGLKTPLAILSAEARRLTGDGKRDASARIMDQIQSMQTHVDRELARARTRGAAAALGAHVDAVKSIERIVRVMSRLPRGDLLTWRWEVPADLTLRMDPDDFGEVLGNLLDNARKWAATSVTLECQIAGLSAQFCVKDDGPGFDRSEARPAAVEGERPNCAGLGLTIARDVLSAYGSDLRIGHALHYGCVSFTANCFPVAAGQLPLAFGTKSGRPRQEFIGPARQDLPNQNVIAFSAKTDAAKEIRPYVQ